jgi:glycosyltransferase involved in cell wall biosynthesis
LSFVSVVMAVCNGEQFLRQQVGSVLSELLPGDELIIIDDASTDASLTLLKAIPSHQLQIYSNASNLGVIGSFERGLQIATHEFVFLSDQDDVWLAGKRAAFIFAFERDPRTLLVVSDAEIIDANGTVTAPSFMATRGGFRGDILSTLVRNRYLGCAMALRRELLVAALPIPRSVPMHDMWLGALGRILGKIHHISVPLLQYRRHANNASPSQKRGWLQILRWRLALLLALAGRLCLLKIGLHATLNAPASARKP